MKPIKIVYDEKGNTLSSGSAKKAFCKESDIEQEVIPWLKMGVS